jgi:hypothetical protein
MPPVRDRARVLGADGVPDAVLVGHVLEQVGVRPDLRRPVPPGEQALAGRGDVHRALQQAFDVLALAAERCGMVRRHLDLPFRELADAAREDVEPLRDEVCRRLRRGTDPIERLRAQHCGHRDRAGAGRQAAHHDAAAHLVVVEAHTIPPEIISLDCVPRWPGSRSLHWACVSRRVLARERRLMRAQPTARNKGRVGCA